MLVYLQGRRRPENSVTMWNLLQLYVGDWLSYYLFEVIGKDGQHHAYDWCARSTRGSQK